MPSTWRPSTWRWLCSCAALAAVLPTGAAASSWPAARGGPARTAAQEIEPGALPVAVAWSFSSAALATTPVITGGAGPDEQRVAYGTVDGRVHVRVLGTGVEVGPAGGTLVADAAVTDVSGALRTAFASTSSDGSPGTLLVVHNDGGGVEIARFDEVTGRRLGFDRALPGGLGCAAIGAPLLTPPAADGTRLLFFVISGTCAAGEGLVRLAIEADGTLGEAAVGVVGDPVGDPAMIVDGSYLVAVARPGGVDLFEAGGTLAAPAREIDVTLPDGEQPVAVASSGDQLLLLSRTAGDSRVRSIGSDGDLSRRAELPGEPVGLAADGQRVVAATDEALHVLGFRLSLTASVPGGETAPSVAGDVAFQGGRAVDLLTGAVTGLPPADVAPAVARGLVVYGPLALATRDVTPPSLTRLRGLAVIAADDRGVAGVRFTVAGRRLAGTSDGSAWAPARYSAAVPRALSPGSHRVTVRATDLAGNVAAAGTRLRVACARTLRGAAGADRLQGGPQRDCVNARSGDDSIALVGGGADRVRCGPGVDTVRADRADRVGSDCERITRRGG